MTKTLWELPFPSSWGTETQVKHLGRRNLALIIEGDNENGDLQLVFEQVEAYKCTYLFALTREMNAAYDKLVDFGETSWLVEVRNRMLEHGEGLSSPSGPPDQLQHLMFTFDDGPCYEFLCQKFHIEQIPANPERWSIP
jgi:hypothetical protein